ncbi:MFS transporter [Lacrimispora algidixylanolytica]|uniref:MFS transporter n=1 Tax=Lacrimispora algidixylanolytica TaxID=94868 RepID=A0A419T2H1_9FIRM|nr:MFS transporter [Lacrimispora algidixylanolytica]RKD31750.1 MFS transporter [Lacrimispora algidixylanolytica]
MKNTIQSWKRHYLTIIIGQSISLIGSSAVQFSIFWWLASATGSPIVMSLAALFSYLPQILLGPIAGVWVDRLNRKTVIICADLFVGATTFLVAIMFWLNYIPFTIVYIVMAIRSAGNAFHRPAIQAAIPMLVPKKYLVKANGWGQFLQSGSNMLGPVIGAAMLLVFPLWLILLTDTVGAIIASIAVGVVKIPDPCKERQQTHHFWSEMKEGFTTLANDKTLLLVTLITFLAMVFYAPLSSYYPLMSSEHFDVSAWHAGFVELVYTLGMMLTALFFSHMTIHKNKIAAVHIGALLLGLASLVCGLLPGDRHWFGIFTLACFISGIGYNVFNIPYIAYIQETIPAGEMGRVYSLISSLSTISMPLGLLIAGSFSEQYGVGRWFLIAGIAICLLTTISVFIVNSLIDKQFAE